MNATLNDCAAVLSEAGFSTKFSAIQSTPDVTLEVVAFEDATVIGFVVAYETATELLASWKTDRDRILMRHREALQAAQQKAWNAYLVLTSRKDADSAGLLALGQIEEDLEGIRKITKAGVIGLEGARQALLQLLPLRAAPVLDPVDMPHEIRSRCTELGDKVIFAFLSNAEENVVMQLLEDQA